MKCRNETCGVTWVGQPTCPKCGWHPTDDTPEPNRKQIKEKRKESVVRLSSSSDYGRAAIRFIRRGYTLGFEKVLQEELEKPTCNDPDWCRTIVALAAGNRPPQIEPDLTDPGYVCRECSDTGFVIFERTSHQADSRPCQSCDAGMRRRRMFHVTFLEKTEKAEASKNKIAGGFKPAGGKK